MVKTVVQKSAEYDKKKAYKPRSTEHGRHDTKDQKNRCTKEVYNNCHEILFHRK
jgi:hypothetical protein